MIKSILIRRATVNAPITEPIQISQNLQIAINNGTNITIFDPKLPSIHKSIINTGKETGNLLDPQDIYDVTNILHSEFLDGLGIRNLDNLMIENADSSFTISRLYEPLISSHKWSFIDPTSKDCYLGVLLTTSELILLKRNTLVLGNYSAEFFVFHQLLDHLYLPIENLSPTGDVVVSKTQFNSLIVKLFEFSQVVSANNVFHDLLAIVNGNKEISIYYIQEGLPKINSINTIKDYVKIMWTSWKTFEGKQSSFLILTSTKNEIDILQLFYDPKSETFEMGQFKEVSNKSRFLVSHVSTLQFKNTELIVLVQANFIKLYELQSNGDSQLSFQSKLSCGYTAAGVNLVVDNDKLIIDISFENGTFQRFELQDSQFQSVKAPKLLTSFVDRSIYTFQQAASKQDEEITDDIALNDNIELTGKFINLGTKFIEQNGVLLLLHKTVANTLNYTINSLRKYSVSWIPINSLGINYTPVIDAHATSLAHINSKWFTKYTEIPPVPRLLQEENASTDISSFLSTLDKFKSENFSLYSQLIQDLDSKNPQKSSSLPNSLYTNIQSNPTIKNLQILYNFNLVLVLSLNAISTKASSYKEFNKAVQELKDEQVAIKESIRNYLIQTVFSFLGNFDGPLDNFDKFLLLNYYLILGKKFAVKKVPQTARIEVTTTFVSESFQLTRDEQVDDQEKFEKTVNSESNHQWTRCELTTLPLIDLVNKRDELSMHNYIASNYGIEPDSIAHILLTTINYCPYTGNKTFNVEV